MRIAIILAAAIASQPIAAQTNAVLLSTLRSDGTTNTWTRSDLADALGMLNRKYWRDMGTAEGRADWHGGVVSSAVSTNAEGGLVRTDVYADGYEHSERAAVRPARSGQSVSAEDAAAARVSAIEARIAAQGAVMSSNLAAIATDGAAALAYSRAAVERMRLERMLERERARLTNTVGVVIIPAAEEGES